MENLDLIDKMVNHLPQTLAVLGILLLIGAITKGNINLGFVHLPEIKKPQVIALGSLGTGLILAAILIACKPWQKNHPPIAENVAFPIGVGETKMINYLATVRDADEDSLSVSILQYPTKGKLVALNNAMANFTSNEDAVGTDTIIYSVNDGKQGSDTATITITFTSAPVKYVDYKSRIVDVFGFPQKKGSLEAFINNKAETIIINNRGVFEKKAPVNTIGYFPLKGDTVDFIVTNPNSDSLLVYNPIDSIQIVFCKDYDKKAKQAIGIFKNEFEIPFSELEIDSTIGDPKMRRLYYGVKIFGPNISGYTQSKSTQTLQFKISNQSNNAFPIHIKSGISSTGWNTNGNQGLSKGVYQLQVLSKQGAELANRDFEIK